MATNPDFKGFSFSRIFIIADSPLRRWYNLRMIPEGTIEHLQSVVWEISSKNWRTWKEENETI
jgi:hypothetical protein